MQESARRSSVLRSSTFLVLALVGGIHVLIARLVSETEDVDGGDKCLFLRDSRRAFGDMADTF
jgi:hypothetical protein